MKHNEPLFGSLSVLYGVLMCAKNSPSGYSGAFGKDGQLSDHIKALMKVGLACYLTDTYLSTVPLLKRQAERVYEALEKNKTDDVMEGLLQLHDRAFDFLKGQTLLVVPPEKQADYESPLSFWRDIPDKFPRAIDAMEEAQKCFALGRNTAVVFHCLAVMQDGLDALARHLGEKIDIFLTWEKIIEAIESGVKKKRVSMAHARWKAVEAFYDESLSDLRSVKNAWRNPTMHFRRSYNEQQASKVRDRVRDFMLHIGTKPRGRPPRRVLGL